jgi:antitoxin component of MazEF toxin-antitoxin module
MVLRLRLRRVGDAIGVVLPDEALEKLRAGEGDAVYLSTDGPDRALHLSTAPELARQLSLAEDLVSRYRRTFADLAK